MQSKDWSETKREADVDPSGIRLVKKVTLEKVKPEEKKYLGFALKDLFEVVFKVAGLAAIVIQLSQFRNEVEQQRKGEDDAKRAELKQDSLIAIDRKELDRERLKADSNYRHEQLRLQGESNKQSRQFSTQIATSLKIAADQQISAFKRDENQKRFKIYEPAVSEIEALLADDIEFKKFSLDYKHFKENTLPKIYLVSDKRMSIEISLLIEKLDLFRARFQAEEVAESFFGLSNKIVNDFAKITNGNNRHLSVNRVVLSPKGGGSFLIPQNAIDSLDKATHLLDEFDFQYVEVHKSYKSPNAISPEVSRVFSSIKFIRRYAEYSAQPSSQPIEVDVSAGRMILQEYENFQHLVRKEFRTTFSEASHAKNRLREAMRKEGTLLPD